MKLWKVTTGEEVFKRKQVSGMLSFSPNGRVLTINRGSHIELWRMKYIFNYEHRDLRMELCNTYLLPYFNTVSGEICLAWSLDGRLLAASNGSLVVFNIENGQKVLRLLPTGPFLHPTDPNNAIHTLAFSPDGKNIVIGTNEGIYRYSVLVKQK